MVCAAERVFFLMALDVIGKPAPNLRPETPNHSLMVTHPGGVHQMAHRYLADHTESVATIIRGFGVMEHMALDED
jgi:hypothetical protein